MFSPDDSLHCWTRRLFEIVRDRNDVLFGEVMSGNEHLLALAIALAKHLNLNADVVTVLPAQVRHAGNWLSLSVWPVAALACLDPHTQIPHFCDLLPAGTELFWHRARGERNGMKTRVVLRDSFDLIVLQSFGDRLHECVLAMARSKVPQLIGQVLCGLSVQPGECAAPVGSSIKPVTASTGNRASCSSLCHNLGSDLWFIRDRLIRSRFIRDGGLRGQVARDNDSRDDKYKHSPPRAVSLRHRLHQRSRSFQVTGL